MADQEENAFFDFFKEELENIRDNWTKANDDVEDLHFRGVSHEEKIVVVINGKFQPESVSFEQAIRAGVGIRGLEQGVMAAVADAVSQAEAYFREQISEMVNKFESTPEKDESQQETQKANPIRPRLSAASNDMTVQ